MWVKHIGQIIFFDPPTVIRYLQGDLFISLQSDFDVSTSRSVFYGIGQQLAHDAAQPGCCAYHLHRLQVSA